MQTLDCEKCILLFTDALQDELSASSREFFNAHRAECEKCIGLYDDFQNLSDIIKHTPVAHIPEDFRFNIPSAMIADKRNEKRKITRQWFSVAAIFLVFLSSYIVLENGNFDQKEENESIRMNQNTDFVYDQPTNVTEDTVGSEQRSAFRESSPEVFEEALLERTFAQAIDLADIGFGYELLEYIQEEGGNVTFVIYFYEDETRTLKTLDESLDFLSLSNVRSFYWEKNE